MSIPPAKGDSPESSFHLIVPESHHGFRLDQFLATIEEFSRTRSQLKKLILAGHVRISDRVCRPSEKVRTGEEIEVHLPPLEKMEAIAEPIPLHILYEDSHLIVINKPSSLVVHPSPGHPRGTLVNALLYHCKDLSGIGGTLRPGIVHRLDRYTTGTLVVAKHDRAHLGLSHLFQTRPKEKLDRRYHAIVRGAVREDYQLIETYYGRHPKYRHRFTSRCQDGRRATTECWVRERFPLATLVELKLQTGRTHQIRVHLSDKHHSLIGDPVYSPAIPSRWPRFLKDFSRQALHAVSLSFEHPITGEWISCTSPYPDDFDTLLRSLRKCS